MLCCMQNEAGSNITESISVIFDVTRLDPMPHNISDIGSSGALEIRYCITGTMSDPTGSLIQYRIQPHIGTGISDIEANEAGSIASLDPISVTPDHL